MRLRFWRMSDPAIAQHAERMTLALVEILNFVSDELDYERGPWQDYFTDPATQDIVHALEREYRHSDIFGEEDDEEEGEGDVDCQDRMADISRGYFPRSG